MKLFWNRTSNAAGGCKGVGKELGNALSAPSGWTCPQFLDLRSYCLPKSDQGQTSECVAFATCGVIEAINWKRTHVSEQIDPTPLYNECKRIDGDPGEGTTLTAAFTAAKNLNLIPSYATANYVKTFDDVMFALHHLGPIVGAFSIDDGWQYANVSTGWIPNGSTVLGGHAVVICWEDVTQGAGVQNSWGNWGYKGQGFARLTRAQFDKQFTGGLAIEV